MRVESLKKLGKELSQKRREAAKLFELKIQSEFSALRMGASPVPGEHGPLV